MEQVKIKISADAGEAISSFTDLIAKVDELTEKLKTLKDMGVDFFAKEKL
jgi:hypothetical protein